MGVVDAEDLSLDVVKAGLKRDLQGLQDILDGLPPNRRLKRRVPPPGTAESLVVPAFAALRVIGINPSLYAIRPPHELVFGKLIISQKRRSYSGGSSDYPCPVSSQLVIEPGGELEVVIDLQARQRITVVTQSFSDRPCWAQLKRLYVADVDSILNSWEVLRTWDRDGTGKQGEVLDYDDGFPGIYRVHAVGRKAKSDYVLSCINFEVGNAPQKLYLDRGIGPFEFTVKLPSSAPSSATYRWLLQMEGGRSRSKGQSFVVFNGETTEGVPSGQIHFTGLPDPTATLTLFGKDLSKELAIDTRKARFYTLKDRKRE